MKNLIIILKWVLYSGSLYFLGIAIAHMSGFKIPVLYVYFDVPSHAYQDKIISFLAFGWSVFLFLAAQDPVGRSFLVKGIILSGLFAIAGLAYINFTTEFPAEATSYWLETGGLGIYLCSVWILYYSVARSNLS